VVGDECLIGMGSIVRDGAVAGAGSLIGAGAVVTPGTKIPPGSLALGAPAKVVRPAGDGERRMIELSWNNYVNLARQYRLEGLPEAAVEPRSVGEGVAEG